jgi:hypothetical protein
MALAYGPVLYQVSRSYQQINSRFAGLFNWLGRLFLRLLYGKAYLELAQTRDDMRAMQELLADRLGDKQISGEEISQIMNRYEQAAQQLETTSSHLKSVSFPRRLWQEVRRLVE